MSLTGIIGTLYSVRKEKSKLQRMVEKSNNSLENKLIVDENSQNRLKFETVLSPDLVIGNIIQLDEKVGQTMSCDVILLTGNVLMNEGMLTGESMPITKIQASTAGENQFYNHNEHKQHTIYCGTEVLQCRQIDSEPCLGLVIRTGFWTTKGSLIRSILYPKPSNLKLQRDSICFILSFAKLASIGFFYSLYILWKNGATLHETIMKPLDMITVIVPPALPAAVAVGVLYAQNRLKKFHEISCISPTRINVAGQVDIAAFDKTGTLTEDGLRLKSVSVVKSENSEVGENRAFSVDDEMLDTDDKILISTSKTENCSNAEENSTNLLSTPSATNQNGKNQNFTSTSSSKNNPEFTQVHNSNQISDMMHTAMAACHTLTILNGEIRGDPLDVEMFNFTNFIYNEPDQKNHDTLQVSTISHKNNPHNIFGFQRQIPFTSLAQRMSVVVKSQLTNTSIIFTKGAPEKVASLCKKSEIPDNYFKELSKLTSKGYRVIAMAYRINKIKLEDDTESG
jgi:cation-transporting ATPase 13A3/4/5